MQRATPVRQRRLESGLTQVELADRAGVSRQLVAAVEAGRNVPAVDAAMRIAHALGVSVEDLFGREPDGVVGALGGAVKDGAPLRIGRVGKQLVGVELADHGVAGAGWARPDGVLRDGRLRLFPGGALAGLVIAGCDPAFGVAERILEGLGPRSLLAISASTGRALRALAAGTLHGAVVHGRPGALPAPPVAVARWHVARWQVGLAVSPVRRARSFEALVGGKTPIVQREPAAASQQAFERARQALGIVSAAAGPLAGGHLDAARMAATLRGAGVTNESAARAFGLRFLELEEHVVELWLAERWLDHPGVGALVELLRGSAFTERIASFGGYELSGCGDAVAGAR